MSSIRFGRGREYQFFRREDLRTHWNLSTATQFLNRFRSDAVAMSGLRRQALGGGALGGQSTASDDQAILVLARMLVSGELVVVLPQRDNEMAHLNVLVPEEAAREPVRERAAPERQEQENPTFDSDHDGVAQAAALIAAAKAAYPFCEECQKAAIEQMQGAGVQ